MVITKFLLIFFWYDIKLSVVKGTSCLVDWCKILIHKLCKIAKSYWCPTSDLKLLHLLPVMQWVAIQDDSWAVKFYHACCWALDSHDLYHLPLLERNHILAGVSLSDILRLNSQWRSSQGNVFIHFTSSQKDKLTETKRCYIANTWEEDKGTTS